MDYLQQEVGWVVQQHHNCSNPYEVGAVGETNQWDGGNVMDDLFLKILQATGITDKVNSSTVARVVMDSIQADNCSKPSKHYFIFQKKYETVV